MRLASDPFYDSVAYRELRAAVILRDGGFCVLCGYRGSLLGYVTPREYGGADDPANTFCCCRTCYPSARLTIATTIEEKRRITRKHISTQFPVRLLQKSRP